MSKSLYFYCKKYDRWINDLKKIEASEEQLECLQNCMNCEHKDNIWVEED